MNKILGGGVWGWEVLYEIVLNEQGATVIDMWKYTRTKNREDESVEAKLRSGQMRSILSGFSETVCETRVQNMFSSQSIRSRKRRGTAWNCRNDSTFCIRAFWRKRERPETLWVGLRMVSWYKLQRWWSIVLWEEVCSKLCFFRRDLRLERRLGLVCIPISYMRAGNIAKHRFGLLYEDTGGLRWTDKERFSVQHSSINLEKVH